MEPRSPKTPSKSSPARSGKAKKSTSPPSPSAASASPTTNLETIGGKLKVYSLRLLLENKRTFKRAEPTKLGDVVSHWYEKEISKPAEKLQHILELWHQHVPPKLAEGTKVAHLTRGTLLVLVASTTLRVELEGLLRSGLQQTLQSLSAGRVYRIKTCVDAQAFRL